MATRTCPDCGTQYVATVRRCIDCDAMLIDEVRPEVDGEDPGPSGSAGTPVGTGDQIGYELEGWGNQLKVTLEGMLAKAGIGRVWEAGALVVAATDEEVVDDLIATLEGGELVELDDETPRVALEIEGMDADDHAELDARLLAAAVPHSWDDEDGALIVAETDEERVLAIVEEVLDGAVDDGDGLAAQQALSALYVAVDRLVKNPHDRKLATAFRRAAAGLDGLAVPYGFAADDWTDLAAEADRLSAEVAPHADPLPTATGSDDDDEATDDDAEPDDDAVVEDGDPVDADDDAAEPDNDEPDDEGANDDEPDDEGADDEVSDVDRARAAAQALRERLTDLV